MERTWSNLRVSRDGLRKFVESRDDWYLLYVPIRQWKFVVLLMFKRNRIFCSNCEGIYPTNFTVV